MKKVLLFGISAVVLLASCVKEKKTAIGEAHVRFVNAVINSPAHDVYINDKKVSSGVLSFGAVTPYISYTSGINAMGFVDPVTGTINAQENWGSDIGDYSTLYFYGTLDGRLTAGGIKDNLTAPAAGKARVRFINLDYNLTKALTVTLVGGTDFFNTLTFASASPYYEVNPGAKFQPSATGVKVAPVIDLNIQAGKIYNVLISGPADSVINAFGYVQN
jgi:hypothetical protein